MGSEPGLERTRDWSVGDHLCPVSFCIALVLFLAPSPSTAAPHLFGLRPEPVPASVGIPLPERLEQKTGVPRAAWKGEGAAPASAAVLFLRVDFPEDSDPATTGTGLWTDPAYARGGDPDYWVNNGRDAFLRYYDEVSHGRFLPEITISPAVYRLPRPMASYDDTTFAGYVAIIRDAVDAVGQAPDGERIPLQPYDALMIVHAGTGEETDAHGDTPGDFWSSMFSTDSAIVTAWDGTIVHEAILMPQTASQDGRPIDPLGVYVHEFGHWLGLVDLYDTSEQPRIIGVGRWSLMGDGSYTAGPGQIPGSVPAHLDAWSKWLLGWFDPLPFDTVEDIGQISLAPVARSSAGLRVKGSFFDDDLVFFVENRQQAGFDAGLPGTGLLLWLVDESRIRETFHRNAVNTDPDRPGIRLIEADGLNNLSSTEILTADLGTASDPFPGTVGNGEFSPGSNPSSSANGQVPWVSLREIVEQGDHVSLVAGLAPRPPAGLVQTDAGESLRLTWDPSEEPDFLHYRVYRDGVFVLSLTEPSFEEPSTGLPYWVTAVDRNGNESAVASTDACAGNTLPDRPLNLVPAAGATGISPEVVTFMSTAFVDGDRGGVHVESRWQICTDSRCALVVYDSGETQTSLTSLVVEAAGLDMGATYYWRVSYGDGCAFSSWSAVTTFTTETAGDAVSGENDAGGGSGGCFIASAAYGSYLAPEVAVLRDFRDRVLLKTPLGRRAVLNYYRISPPIARLVSNSRRFRTVTRWFLTPVAMFVKHPGRGSLFTVVVVAGLVGALRRRRIGEAR